MSARLTAIARLLRKNSTDVERLLWRHLRAGQFGGHKFKRQQPLGCYVVDFVCFEARLIIELDGGQHTDQVEADKIRDQWLNDEGFRVLRFWNNEVLTNLEGVMQCMQSALLPSPPLPSPPPRGGRELPCECQRFGPLSPCGRGLGRGGKENK
ncbi:MAG: endonuclease domain-containing protein [Sulfuricella sp.]|nr:endonuclease domain-containing protein [Sulfuricella sp.]